MAAQRKLLFLLPFAPHPDATHGGSKVLAQLLSMLAAHHRLALIYFRGAGENAIDEGLRRRCDLVEEVERPWTGASSAHRWIRRARLLVALVRGRPMWVSDWTSHAYAARIRSLIRQWQPDIIHIQYHIMGQYLAELTHSRVPRVLTEHEPAARAAPYLWSSSRVTELINNCDRRAWRQFERSILHQVDAVIVFTDADRAAVQVLAPNACTVRIPPGTDIPETPLNPIGGCPPRLLFFGSFVHPPNVDAALRLTRTIFPVLQKRLSNLQLYIVGDQPPPELAALANSNVIVTGRVPDMTPYLDRASVVVAPLRLGGGMRVKVLEALAAGKAVVASPLAIEGLDLRHGEHVWLAETDVEFCRGIDQLLSSVEHRAYLAQHAREWAQANLGWTHSIAAYDALHDRLLRVAHPQ